jgi:nitroimidazol reductase NimA-like FMN-containing flavoprotein (pyridoxamine 5'-phosphate oxidase superfamily)
VIFGRIRVVENDDEQSRFFTAFMSKYAPADSWGRDQGSFPRMGSTIVYAITPELITGKRGQLPAANERWPARNLSASPEWKRPHASPTK